MDRLSYFIRRLLLIIPTFLGITFSCFLIIQFVPGGPVEQAIIQLRGGGGPGGDGGSSGGALPSESINETQRKAIEAHFGFDKPIIVQYWDWLVVKRMGMQADSYKYSNKTVWQLIKERFPISITFGITGFFLTYLICIPLGIAKALRNGSWFDVGSSILVFIGYAIPAFAFGMLLKLLFSGITEGYWDLFPLGGFNSENYETLSIWGKIKDRVHHMVLPLSCYVIGNFAVLTLLMKNSLLEQISQDYVRTVLAKGGTLNRAIWGHALRNSLIAIATGFGGVMTIIFAGSILIEKVFSINGLGLLSIEAIVSRDYMIFMGIIALQSVFSLIGRVLSDFCYVLIDPRINFNRD